MDEIQKILIKQGRKDLAQKYYEKITSKSFSRSTTKDLIELYENTKSFDIRDEVLSVIYARAKKSDPIALRFYKGIPGTKLKLNENK